MQPFEQLESRLLLTATAKMSGSTLVIAGDNADDAVLVVGTGLNKVSVFIDRNGDGDVVDAQDFSADFTNAKSIKVSLKGGRNVVLLADLDLSGSVSIKTGSGNDSVGVGPVLSNTHLIRGNLNISTGGGDDNVIVEGDIGRNVSINLGSGDDDLDVGLDTIVDIGGNSNVKFGSGDDSFDLGAVLVDGRVSLNGGSGHDVLRTEYGTELQDGIDSGQIKLTGFERIFLGTIELNPISFGQALG